MFVVAFHDCVVISFKNNREMLGHFSIKCQAYHFKMLRIQLQADDAKIQT